LEKLQKEDSLSFYSCFMITKWCAVDLHIRNTKQKMTHKPPYGEAPPKEQST
jgi:hypothetical protein